MAQGPEQPDNPQAQPGDPADADAATGQADAGSREAPTGRNVELPSFQQVLADAEERGIDLLHDVELNVKIELGRTGMLVEDVLRLGEGCVVELDKLAGDPVDVYVNDRLVARGEVLVVNDAFCVRVSELVADLEETSADQEAEASADNSADRN